LLPPLIPLRTETKTEKLTVELLTCTCVTEKITKIILLRRVRKKFPSHPKPIETKRTVRTIPLPDRAPSESSCQRTQDRDPSNRTEQNIRILRSHETSEYAIIPHEIYPFGLIFDPGNLPHPWTRDWTESNLYLECIAVFDNPNDRNNVFLDQVGFRQL